MRNLVILLIFVSCALSVAAGKCRTKLKILSSVTLNVKRRDCELELVGYSSTPHENFLHWRMVERDVGNYSQLGNQG